MGICWGLVVAVSPWQSSRYLMAKDEHTVIRSACLAGAAILVLYLVLVMASSTINLVNDAVAPNERAMIWAAFNLMPTLPGVLLMAGVTAAALSSASTFLSLIGFAASHDLMVQRNVSEGQQLLITRLTILAVGLVVLTIAFFQAPAIMVISYFAATLFASAWGPVAFMSVWSRRMTAAAAFWGIIAGFLGNMLSKVLVFAELITLPIYLDPLIIGLLLSIVTIVLVSRKGEVSAAEKSFLEKIHRTPEAEIDANLLRFSLGLCYAAMVGGLVLLLLLWQFYLIPYHQAVSSETEGLVVSILKSGEFLHSLFYSSMLSISGLLGYYCLKRDYQPSVD